MRITCVVDDQAPPGSGLLAEHGISFFIASGGQGVLFDTGSSGRVLLANLAQLGIAVEQIDALVISHAHNDHTGGLSDLLDRRPGIPMYAHPDLFRERYARTTSGVEKIGPMVDRVALEGRVSLHLTAEPVEVVPGVWTSGEIAERSEIEGRSARHVIRQDGDWLPDPYGDDLAVVLKTAEGLVLVCGCCHAGLLNTLHQVRRAFGDLPAVIVGGTHLKNTADADLERVIKVLRQDGPPRLWLGHCTGQKAFRVLRAALGERVRPCRAGTVIDLPAAVP